MSLRIKPSVLLPSEVLSIFLDELSTSELFSCRLVNQSWGQEATRLITQRKDWRVPFIFCNYTVPPTFIRNFRRPGESSSDWSDCASPAPKQFSLQEMTKLVLEGKKKTLEDFTSCIAQSSNHPLSLFLVTRLEFDYFGGELELPEMVHFLQTFGPYIKEIRLRNYANYYLGQNGWSSKKCILNYMPNLESLILCVAGGRADFYPGVLARRLNYENESENDDAPIFQNLKFIEVIGHDFKQELTPSELKLVNLLTIVPNVQSVYFNHQTFQPHHIMTPFFFKMHKLNLLKLKKIRMELFKLFENNAEPLEQLEKLVNFGQIDLQILKVTTDMFALRRLSFLVLGLNPILVDNWARMFHCLVKLLQKNKNTLENIIFGDAVVYFLKNPKTLAHFPVLANVSTLNLYCTYIHINRRPDTDTSAINYDYIPQILFENFPVALPTRYSRTISTIFPRLQSMVIFWVDAHPNWFPFWDEVFPTVKTLDLYPGIKNEHNNLVIPKLPEMFPNLTTLTLHIKVPESEAQIFGELLKLTSLEKLVLVIKSNRHKYEQKVHNELAALEALLGVKMPTLENIYQSWEYYVGMSQVANNLSSFPSVFHFSGLKELFLDLQLFESMTCKFFVRCFGLLLKVNKADFQVYFVTEKPFDEFSTETDSNEAPQTISRVFMRDYEAPDNNDEIIFKEAQPFENVHVIPRASLKSSCRCHLP